MTIFSNLTHKGKPAASFKRVLSLILAGLLTLTFFSGCKKKVPEPSIENYPVTVLDVTFEKAPEKVAVLNPAILETMFDLGYGAKVVAKGTLCDDIGAEHSEKAANLKVCGSATDPKVSELKALGVEVVFVHAAFDEAIAGELTATGIKTVILPVPSDLSGIKADYISLHQIFNGKTTGIEQANESYKKIEAEIAAVEGILAEQKNLPKAKGIYLAAKADIIATSDTLIGKFLPTIGIENLAGEGSSGWKIEGLAEKSAEIEVIFCPETLVSTVKEMAIFKETPAVKNDFVFGVKSADIERKSMSFFKTSISMANMLKAFVYKAQPDATTDGSTRGTDGTTTTSSN